MSVSSVTAQRRTQLSVFGALFVALVLALLLAAPLHAQAEPPVWTEPDGQGGANVHLYFFHSYSCPHCQEALPFIEELASNNSWLKLHEYEVTTSRTNSVLYSQYAQGLGQVAQYVPGFFFCGQMITGYGTTEVEGAALRDSLLACHEQAVAEITPVSGLAPAAGLVADAPVAVAAQGLTLPLIGALNVDKLSLPLLTVVIAAMDAFNPCAFFVLMFLLSLMVHARNRGRMLLIGGVFVLFSALIYFVFMSAWLNVFLLMGELRIITVLAGLVAVVLALINIKDFFWFKQGVTLSMSDSARGSLFGRMRTLVSADSLPTMLGSTVVLAIAANSYELLCTSGFPMVYTRALTLHDLAPAAYYGWLALYNLVYVIPLLAIVTIFAARFGSRKLSEYEGRVLKLVSGIMMLLLGVLLVVAPASLSNPLISLGLLLLAVLASVAIVQWEKRHPHKPTPPRKHSGKLAHR